MPDGERAGSIEGEEPMGLAAGGFRVHLNFGFNLDPTAAKNPRASKTLVKKEKILPQIARPRSWRIEGLDPTKS
jgi:hypothetical protein